MNIGQAIVLLIEKYEYAKKQDYIVKKVAWALYQTWKEVDEKEEKQNENLGMFIMVSCRNVVNGIGYDDCL